MGSSKLKSYKMSFRTRAILFALIAAGAVSIYMSSLQDPTRAWFNFLICAVFFLSLGLFGLFFTAVQHITSARWSVVVRRVLEVMSLTLPVAGLLILLVYIGAHHIYEWSHSDVVAADHILQGKVPYLNMKFFGLRLLIYFSVWIAGSLYLFRNSYKQDLSGDVKYTHRNKRASALILVLFGISVCAVAFDLLMSVEPHWFSTIFGIYFFAGLFQAGLAMLYVLCWMLLKAGVLKPYANKEHFHDMARLIFGFSVFWAYIGFSQYLLIWYADLPEETFFYTIRSQKGWEWVSLGLVFVRLIVPFFGLIAWGSKRCYPWVLTICGVIFFGQWLDFYWIAHPAMRLMHHGEVHGPHIGLSEIGAGLGILALFLLIMGLIMERIRMVAIKDPRIEVSKEYYLHHEEEMV